MGAEELSASLGETELRKGCASCLSVFFFEDFIFKSSLCPTWGLNLQPQDQESRAQPTESTRRPLLSVFIVLGSPALETGRTDVQPIGWKGWLGRTPGDSQWREVMRM